jgi:anti-anti-sigma factor
LLGSSTGAFVNVVEGEVPMLEVTTTDDGRPALRGDLDLLCVSALEAVFAQLNGQAEIDLSGVTFFDSSALRAFLVGRKRNPQLRIVNPSKAVVKVLEITDTLDYFVNNQ